MKRVPPLLIIFQQTTKATAFWLLHPPQVAGWLRQNPQAEQKLKVMFIALR
jgi:hypothetical protein